LHKPLQKRVSTGKIEMSRKREEKRGKERKREEKREKERKREKKGRVRTVRIVQ
jgi:hypothetical protein